MTYQYNNDHDDEDWEPEYNEYWTEDRIIDEQMVENESYSELVVWEIEDPHEGICEWFDDIEYWIFDFEEC